MSIEKVRIESQEELGQMISKEISQIDKDLTVICSNVQINNKTTLDILCYDGNGQLVIVQLDVNEDDIMLLHGIQSLDYIDKFKSFLKATYNKHKIDDKEKPRLILIAPSFSDALRRAVESMKGIRVDLYEWEYLKLGDHKGLRLQPIFTSEPMETPKEEKPVEKKREPKASKKKEPEPEPEIREEPKPEPEPLEPKPELPEEEFKLSPPPEEEPKEEEASFKQEKEEPPPKRKLKLF